MIWNRHIILEIRVVLTALLLVAMYIGYPAAGQVAHYLDVLKKDNPDELFVFYNQLGNCPFTEDSIDSMIDGRLTRSRLQRIQSSMGVREDGFGLGIVLNCDDAKDDDGIYIFSVEGFFLERVTVQKPWGPMEVFMVHHPLVFSYGKFGAFTHSSNGDKARETMRNAVRETLEDALTDYLKANFDL